MTNTAFWRNESTPRGISPCRSDLKAVKRLKFPTIKAASYFPPTQQWNPRHDCRPRRHVASIESFRTTWLAATALIMLRLLDALVRSSVRGTKTHRTSDSPADASLTFSAHTHTHTHIPPWEDQCEWHRTTRMTGPDCAVMCNLMNTHTHTHTHTHVHTHTNKHTAFRHGHTTSPSQAEYDCTQVPCLQDKRTLV